jgi:hypothetical protein
MSVLARPPTPAGPSPTTGGVHPGVGAVFTRDDVFSAFALRDTDVLDTLCSTILSEDEDGLTDFEHDDHADVHVIRDEEAAAFFDSMVKGESPLLGFEENMRILASGRGTLVRDMGVGVYVKTAMKNLLSAIQLRKAYSCLRSSGSEIVYAHVGNKSTITFRLGEDGYYHTKLASPAAGVCRLSIFTIQPP